MASTCIQRKMEVKLEIFHCQTGNVSYFGFYMSLRNIRAYANIHIFSVGFYPDAGAGPSCSSFRPDNETFTLDDFDSLSPEEPAAQGDPDVLGYSQLGRAPLGISQQQTPQPLARHERQVRSPDVLTYSEGHGAVRLVQ